MRNNMRLFYFRNEMYMPGGIGRVLTNKVNYLIEKYNYDIYIIIMNQENKQLYYNLNKKVKIIDLKIKYNPKTKNIFLSIVYKILKNIIYRSKVKKLIDKHKPDFLISMGELDTFFIPKFKNKNLKIIREYHFNKSHRLYREKNNFIVNLKNTLVTKYEEYLLKNYDKVIILTNEDRENWKDCYNINVIHNSLTFYSQNFSELKNKRIISIGRLEEQKGFDILIDVWKKVNEKHSDWVLEIYGEGSLRKELQDKINFLNLTNNLFLRGNEKNIRLKYLESSIYVMTSRYEGMPMVLLEAMSCGLPLISFDCPCGPKDIIKDGKNGFLIKFGDIEKMAEKINYLIENEEKRAEMGKKSKELSYNYSEDKIMPQWKKLFEELSSKVDNTYL